MPARLLDPAAADLQPPLWRKRIPAKPGLEKAAALPGSAQPSVPVGIEHALHAKIEQLAADAAVKIEQARQAGYREGEAAGREAAAAAVREAVARLGEAVSGLEATRRKLLRNAEEDVVRLSIDIARRVLHRELAVDRGSLAALVKAAIARLEGQEVYKVRVSPGYEGLLHGWLAENGRDGGIEIVADSTLAAGGLVFEIGRGMLDASVETQLREIERGLADYLEERR